MAPAYRISSLALIASLATATHAQQSTPQSPEQSAEIVVTAQRIRGSVDTDVPPVVELTEADIAAYGADSLTDLVARDNLHLRPEKMPRTRRAKANGRLKQIEQIVRRLLTLMALSLHIVFAPPRKRAPAPGLPEGVELVTFPGSGHAIHVEQRDAVNAALRRHFARVGAARRAV